MDTIILCIIVFSGLILILYFLSRYIILINRSFKTNENSYGNKESDKKVLILYAPSMHDSVEQVKQNAVEKFLSRGFFVKTNYPYEEINYNYNEFDMICYITPVYMSKVSRAICEAMVSSNYIKKKVIIISVGNEMDKKDELNYMKGLIDKANEFHLIKLKKEEKVKLNNFLEVAIIE